MDTFIRTAQNTNYGVVAPNMVNFTFHEKLAQPQFPLILGSIERSRRNRPFSSIVNVVTLISKSACYSVLALARRALMMSRTKMRASWDQCVFGGRESILQVGFDLIRAFSNGPRVIGYNIKHCGVST